MSQVRTLLDKQWFLAKANNTHPTDIKEGAHAHAQFLRLFRILFLSFFLICLFVFQDGGSDEENANREQQG